MAYTIPHVLPLLLSVLGEASQGKSDYFRYLPVTRDNIRTTNLGRRLKEARPTTADLDYRWTVHSDTGD